MKRICVGLFLLSMSLFASHRVLASGLLADFFGVFQSSNNSPYRSYSCSDVHDFVGMDVAATVLEIAEMGFGIEWELVSRDASPGAPNSFQFQHLFFLARLPLRVGPLTFYPVARVGMGVLVDDSLPTGIGAEGLYYAIGAGLRSPEFRDSPKDRFLFYVYAEVNYSGPYSTYSGASFTIGLGGRSGD